MISFSCTSQIAVTLNLYFRQVLSRRGSIKDLPAYIPIPHPVSLLCLKRGGVVEADKPISSQIRTWSLSEGSPYETLHDYVANAFAPYFKAYVKETGKIER